MGRVTVAAVDAIAQAVQLRERIDARRAELGMPLWQVAVVLDTSPGRLEAMRNGSVSPALRVRAVAWLETSQPASPDAGGRAEQAFCQVRQEGPAG